MRTRWLLLLALGLFACVKAPLLVPAPEATHLNNQATIGVAEQNGVRLIVGPRQWDGAPSDLPVLVTPVEVTLENHSGVPLEVNAHDFRIVSPSGVRVAALSAYEIQSPGVVYVNPYPSWGYAWGGPYYPGPWPGYYYYGWGPDVYTSYSPPLPSPDMLRKALPEGVLASGGYARGFIYLPRGQHEKAEGNARFYIEAQLVNANTRQVVGTLSVPVVAKMLNW